MATNDHLSSLVSLSLSCSYLPNLDVGSKSDPQISVFEQEQGGTPTLLGSTEMILNNNNPQFAKQIEVRYFFERVQRLIFRVVDVDDPKSAKGDLFGSVEITLGELMGSAGATLERAILNPSHTHRKNGFIRISGFEVSSSNQEAVFNLSATNLDKKDFLGKSDPFVMLYRGDPSGTNFTLVHKTEYIKQNLNPVWQPFKLHLGVLCGGNMDMPLKVEVWDWDKDEETISLVILSRQ